MEAVFGVGALSGAGGPGGSAARRRRGGAGGLGGHLPFTPEAKKSLELSLREALAQGSRTILPGHLLLGLLRVEASPAVELVRARGLDLAVLRAGIRATLV
nr:Clp protease N-terminal domain-containing protein [Streptacidiphilus anmyonensis]